MSRDEILAQYRGRIAAGERTRLQGSELKELVKFFIARVAGLEGEESIRAACLEEIGLLEEGYGKSTVGGNQLPLYRKAIRFAVADGTLALREGTSRVVTFERRNGEAGQEQQHFVMMHMRYDNATYAAIRGEGTEANNLRQDDLQSVVLGAYIAKVRELLGTDDPRRLAVGIAAATGRRFGEVVERGSFESTQHPYVLRFAGQQKKRGEVGAFDVVTILPAAEVLEAIGRFRTLDSEREGDLKVFNVQVNRIVREEFERTKVVPVIEGKKTVSVHRLRGVYGAVAVYYFCPANQNPHRFLQAHLGHVLEEQRSVPNSNATTHYFHYRLVDEKGQALDERGVLLADVGELPEDRGEGSVEHLEAQATDETSPTTATQEMTEVAVAKKSRRTVTVAMADLEQLHSLASQVGVATGSHAGDLRSLLAYLQMQIEQTAAAQRAATKSRERTIQEQEAAETEKAREQEQEAAAQNPGGERTIQDQEDVQTQQPGEEQKAKEQTDESGGTVQALLEQAHALRWLTGRIEGLESQVKSLSDERDHWRMASEQAKQQQPQNTKIEDENRRLKNELAAANQKLDTFRRLLDGNGQLDSTTQMHPGAAVSAQTEQQGHGHGTEQGIGDSKDDAQGEQALELNQDGEQGEHSQSQPIRYPRVINDATSISTASKSGGAMARAERIFEAIQAWNSNADRSERERWAITPGLLEEGFGIHRAAAKQFCTIYKDKIQTHHHAANIKNPLHHNRRKNVNQIRDFVQSFAQSPI